MAGQSFTFTLELPEDLAAELEQLVDETGRDVTSLAQGAIIEHLEDRADYRHAAAVLERERDRPNLTLEEAIRELGLDA